MTRTAAILFLTAILATASFAQIHATKTPRIALHDLNGRTVRLSDFKGKVILINFWATWCVPCRAEIPELVKWQTEFRTRGLQIIGITYPPTNRTRVRKFARTNKINYPILFGTKATKKVFDSSENLPISIVIGSDGRIKDRIDGVIFDDEFETKVKALLPAEGKRRERSRSSTDRMSAAKVGLDRSPLFILEPK
ncbi:MAG TPA: TlpA disulfide reductase family protein [Pyrinomonadaceae bacterium]|nr:TlpA disulfide reductase family protein [Pyrinomonadaceae bacterium]